MQIPHILSCAVATIAPVAAQSEDRTKDAEEAVLELISVPEGASEADGAQDELNDAVRRLVRASRIEELKSLGPESAPALVEMIEEAAPDALTYDNFQNPLVALAVISPVTSLAYFEGLQSEDPVRFELISMVPGGVTDFAPPLGGRDAAEGRVLALMDRVLDTEQYSARFKLEFASRMLGLGFASDASRSYLVDHLDLWTEKLDSNAALGTLYLEEVGDPAQEISLELAKIILEAGPPARVLERLLRSEREAVRGTAIGWIAANASRVGLSTTVRLLAVAAEELPASNDDELLAAISDLRHAELVFEPNQLMTILSRLSDREPVHKYLQEWLAIWVGRTISGASLEDVGELVALVDELLDLQTENWIETINKEVTQEVHSTFGELVILEACASGHPIEFEIALDWFDRRHPRHQSASPTAVLHFLRVLKDERIGPRLIRDSGGRLTTVFAAAPEHMRGEVIVALARLDVGAMLGKILREWSGTASDLAQLARDDAASLEARFAAAFGTLLHDDAQPEHVALAASAGIATLKDRRSSGFAEDLIEGLLETGDKLRYRRNWGEFALPVLRAVEPDHPVVPHLAFWTNRWDHSADFWKSAVEYAKEAGESPAGRRWLQNMSSIIPQAMIEDGDLLDAGLLVGHVRRNDAVETATTAVLVHGSEDQIAVVRRALLRSVRRSSSSAARIAAQQLLRFDLASTVPELTRAIVQNGDPQLSEQMTATMEHVLRMREMGQAFESSGRDSRTRATAVEDVLALLDDEAPEVRIEAIRGLGTLGAIEALPRLIRVLKTGTEPEKAVAKETLAMLNRIAMKNALEATEPAQTAGSTDE